MDLEAESAVQVDTAMSSDIAQSCNKLLETQKQIAKIDEQLKKFKEIETTLSEQTIPNLMQKLTQPLERGCSNLQTLQLTLERTEWGIWALILKI